MNFKKMMLGLTAFAAFSVAQADEALSIAATAVP